MNTPDSEPSRSFRPIDTIVLARYFDGTATPSDQAAVEAWIGEDMGRQAAIAEWHAAWIADAEHFAAAYDAEAAWARLSERVGLLTLVRDGHAPRTVQPISLAPPASPWRAVRWVAAAAVAALAVGAGTWRVADRSDRAPITEVTAARNYTTPPGERGIVHLPDGSVVMLNVDSRLTVPATFGAAGQPRALELQGQAYFTAIHDDSRPFLVHTALGVTRDVGTRFDVRAYAGESVELIAVAEGAVTVRGDTAAVETPLRRGQVAMIGATGRVALIANADVARATAWTQGRLRLDDVTLAEAARELERWYDLDVRIDDDELAQRRVVGSYRDEPVTQVLRLVALAVGAQYELHGRSVVFFGRDRH